MIWVNGELQPQLAVTDRGAQFGDGCFTTARVSDGAIVWPHRHILRLQQAAARLMLPAIDWPLLLQEMQQAARDRTQGVVKVMLTRGGGGRGYSPQGCARSSRIIIQADYPAHYAAWREQGINLSLSPIALARSPLLAGIKHLNRLEQVLIRMRLDQEEAEETLVLDTAGQLVECCSANLFWRKGNQVFTPDLAQAGVAGVSRACIMELLADSRYRLETVSAPPGALADADEVLICNALLPVAPVNQASGWRYRSRTLYRYLCEQMLNGANNR
ncbi:aminodeoxychorismate lyase [Affinibrenneria salicis]|uniref:Aminodeoxychorismate lyase n=1 Tax=Affinibrenneria salicis TaxID=2590031 RepID=A0A5J5G4S2_9GAMM|nr:aminodeoxychorismate lyase [Affinibrenneria salicis]KAA9001204.1 aminodeoxychorismate lyase [Affinibrenneria salicis]